MFLTVLCVLMLLCGCQADEGAKGEQTQIEDPIKFGDIDESEEVSENQVEEPQIIISYSAVPTTEYEPPAEEVETVEEEEGDDTVLKTEDGKVIVDLIIFMGQSNMSGNGGNASYAPEVPKGHGYEFRAISDPTKLYPITEPFGVYENNLSGIYDMPGAKRGSLVSAFANEYYEQTHVPIVAVSASRAGSDTNFWMSDSVISDFSERQKRAQVWLTCNDYYIRNQYVIWLQGESDALHGHSTDQYSTNMDNIIRPLFIGGVEKVFIITPGRTITKKDYFNDIIKAQLELCKNSGYYALATTALCGISTQYMIDEWHYNQTVLNYIGREAAKSAAYYALNKKERCLYDYKNNEKFIPDGYDYPEDIEVEQTDLHEEGLFEVIESH